MNCYVKYYKVTQIDANGDVLNQYCFKVLKTLLNRWSQFCKFLLEGPRIIPKRDILKLEPFRGTTGPG